MEVVSALAWEVHDAPATIRQEIQSRSETITDSIKSMHEMNEETCLIEWDMITAALTIDAMRGSEFPGVYAPDESLNACLTQINADLTRMSRKADRRLCRLVSPRPVHPRPVVPGRT
jgi:hypothetical protein